MRVALCSTGVGVRSLVYPKEECQFCLSPKEQRKDKKNAREIYDELVYKEKKGTMRSDTSKATALKYWAFFTMAEKSALSASALSAITQVRKKVAEHGINMDELVKVIKDENKKTSYLSIELVNCVRSRAFYHIIFNVFRISYIYFSKAARYCSIYFQNICVFTIFDIGNFPSYRPRRRQHN